jgi:cell volume regulation protein A
LIIRDERPFNPDPRERIKGGDELLIVTPEEQRANTEERLRAVGQRGRLARWRARGGE